MNKVKISVIVAVYNAADYLDKCVTSILNQTHNNLELILVDDGSIDNSLALCQEYAKNDNRIRVLTKPNGGQASARNLGILHITGEYIGYVDSDDWVDITMYRTLLDKALSTNADIVQCGWWKVQPHGVQSCPHPDTFEEVYTTEDALKELTISTGKHINTSVCCKLFKRKIIQDVLFREVRAYEDDEFVYKAVAKCNRIVCINMPLYYYLNRENSTMTASFNINKLALLSIQEGICEILKESLPSYYDIAHKFLCSKQFYILYQLNKHHEIKDWKHYFWGVYKQMMANYIDYTMNPIIGANKYMLWCMKYLPKFIWIQIINLKFNS